ncbi:conserved hypothetical protein [Burkholderia vietnamiensis]|nr:conserved hypothetical protein [Burkholderia vietnamiensis]
MRDLGLPASRHQEHQRRDCADVPGRAALGDRRAAAMGLGTLARHAVVPRGRHARARHRGRRAIRRRVRLCVLRADADERVAHGDLPVHRAVLHGPRPASVRARRAAAADTVGRRRPRVRRHRARVRGRLPETARARHVGARGAGRRCTWHSRRRDVGRDDGRRALDVARPRQRQQDAVLPARGVGCRAARARRAARPDLVRARHTARAREPRVSVGDRRVRQLSVVVLAADPLQRVAAVGVHVPVAAVRRRVRRAAARRIGRLALHVGRGARADGHRAGQRTGASARVAGLGGEPEGSKALIAPVATKAKAEAEATTKTKTKTGTTTGTGTGTVAQPHASSHPQPQQ